MPEVLGMDCKFYRASAVLDGASVTPATAEWTEITNIRDLTANLESGEADITTRANSGWRATAATLKAATLEFEMLWDTGDVGFDALKDAWLNGTEIGLAAMDGNIASAGQEGIVGNWRITNFSRSEPLEEGVMVSVTAKASSQMEWYEVA